MKDVDVKKEEVINENILKEHKNIKYVNSIKLPPSYSYYYNPYDYYQYMRKNRGIRKH